MWSTSIRAYLSILQCFQQALVYSQMHTLGLRAELQYCYIIEHMIILHHTAERHHQFPGIADIAQCRKF